MTIDINNILRKAKNIWNKKFICYICISMILTIIFGYYETIYADNKTTIINEQNKYTDMQNSFFEIAYKKELDLELDEKSIEYITNRFIREKTIERANDRINIYSYNNERLSIYSKTSKNGVNKVEGIIYKIYNPSDDISILRMQYHDLKKDGKCIRIEITTESINQLDKAITNLDNNIITNQIYTDYIKIFNRVDLDKVISEDDLLLIKPGFEKSYNFSYREDPYNHYKLEDIYGTLVVNTHTTDNVFSSVELSYGDKFNKYRNCITSMFKDDLEKDAIEYLNLDGKGEWGHTIMIFEKDIISLKDRYLGYISK